MLIDDNTASAAESFVMGLVDSPCMEGVEVYGKTSEYVSKAIKVFEKPTFPSLELANYLKDKNYDESTEPFNDRSSKT